MDRNGAHGVDVLKRETGGFPPVFHFVDLCAFLTNVCDLWSDEKTVLMGSI